jgi:hypothetical protein
METRKELEARKKKLETQIISLQRLDVTKDTAQVRLDAQRKVAPLREQVSQINRQLANMAKPKSSVPKAGPNAPKVAPNAFPGVTDIYGELVAGGVPVLDEDFFAMGGAGSTAFVWESDKEVSSGVLKSGYKQQPVLKLASTEITNFWNDAELQNKIINSYAAKGKSINKLEAFAVWKSLVTTAAEIYQGGKGAKVTPMQLLSDTLKGVGGGEANLPQRSISKLDKDTVFSQIDDWSSNTLMRKLNDDEKESLFTLLNDLNTGTVTEYKKTKNKKTGKLESVSVTTPGLTEAQAQKTIEDRLKELNPDDYDRAKRIDFSSWLSQNMAGA